jgi:hypothetical protein
MRSRRRFLVALFVALVSSAVIPLVWFLWGVCPESFILGVVLATRVVGAVVWLLEG